MHVQIVTFTLEGIDDAAYRARVDAVAPAFAQLPGLRAKVWLADPATRTYGGIYTWQDRGSMEAYCSGEIFRGLQADANLRRVASRDFSVLTEPTVVTQGA